MQMVVPSVGRKINRERVVLLGWGRAILLQFAHPLVAAAIADHSRFDDGMRGYFRRTRRTVGAMLAISFGNEAAARAVITHITATHRQVHGRLGENAGMFPADTMYCARDPHLLQWVHATMLDSSLLAYELFVGPLRREEKDQYCAEAAESGALFGIPEKLLPTCFDELERYMQQMLNSGELYIIPRARTLARVLLRPALGPVAAPLFQIMRLMAIGPLPASIRDGYGFEWSGRQEWLFRKTTAVVRRARAHLPSQLCEWPSARRAA
jgi:uncharacterized protein (DUF2236 family)